MPLRILTWLISLGIHAGFALAMLLPAGGAALQTGAREDTMVVEQGIAIEGFAKMGEDQVSLEEVEADASNGGGLTASAGRGGAHRGARSHLLEGRPSARGSQGTRERGCGAATAATDRRRAAGKRGRDARKLRPGTEGRDATAHSQYVGALRTHLERHKINPRTNLIGTAVVRFKVNAAGELLKREIATSSGKKALDDAALASIEKSAPFPKMPEGLSETIELSVPFRFTVR